MGFNDAIVWYVYLCNGSYNEKIVRWLWSYVLVQHIYDFWGIVSASSCGFQVLMHLHMYTFIVVSTLIITVGIELETLYMLTLHI